ncbi:MAG TPA: tRNA (adenosine(37)-N6)-dimethylallyltransferase MiaA [Alphaproteobacteria bacterium]|nr:tRNA (adenosine(37)-N6)-dimethylallyltransferase MiaA [Alphaproteobacteria bacterium]
MRTVVLFGPTASGKSALAVALAQALNGEVINADSRQVYQNIPIITACPTPEDYKAAPHHLFEILPIAEKYSAGRYAADAAQKIAEVQGRGRTPIVVGGTGFYLKSLMEDATNVAAPEVSPEVATALQQRLQKEPLQNLWNDLHAADRDAAHNIKPTDTQRIVRALGVFQTTGKKFSSFKNKNNNVKQSGEYLCLALNPPKEELNARILQRWQAMQKAGVVDEVQLAWAQNKPSAPGLQSVGVRDIGAFLGGQMSWQQAETSYLTAMRQYAKRQRTWLRNSYPAGLVQQKADAAAALTWLKRQ